MRLGTPMADRAARGTPLSAYVVAYIAGERDGKEDTLGLRAPNGGYEGGELVAYERGYAHGTHVRRVRAGL